MFLRYIINRRISLRHGMGEEVVEFLKCKTKGITNGTL
jgi:hypothetical protein